MPNVVAAFPSQIPSPVEITTFTPHLPSLHVFSDISEHYITKILVDTTATALSIAANIEVTDLCSSTTPLSILALT